MNTETPLPNKPTISLRQFVPFVWTIIEPTRHFIPNWHIDAICDHLEAVSLGQINRLLINAPPRTMKSLLVSVIWPAWVWTFAPSHRTLCSPHSQSVANRDGSATIRIIESNRYQAQWGHTFDLLPKYDKSPRYETAQGGVLDGRCVGHPLLGLEFDTVIADDPNGPHRLNNYKQEWDWIFYDWMTAIAYIAYPPTESNMVIIQTRASDEDVSGHVLKESGWVHLCLPSKYERGRGSVTVPLKPGEPAWEDPRRVHGELLWPEVWPLDRIEDDKRMTRHEMHSWLHQQCEYRETD